MEKSELSDTFVGNTKQCSWYEKSLAGNQKFISGLFLTAKVVTQMSTGGGMESKLNGRSHAVEYCSAIERNQART